MARVDVNTVNENIEILNNELNKLLKNDYSNDRRSAWYMLMYPIARLLREKMERQQYQIDKMNLLNCVGNEIDEHLANSPFLFYRKKPSKATLKVELIGGLNIPLEIGDIILESKEGLRYILKEDKILNNKETFLFEAEESGEQYNNEIGSILKIVKIVNGVYDFRQLEGADGGADIESDNEYIKRWFDSLSNSEWNLDGIREEILKQAGVKSVYANENKTMQVDSLGLEPKSIGIVVDGGRDEDIARAIWRKKDVSIQTNGDKVVIIKDSQNIDREIKFYRPRKKEIFVKIDFIKNENANITEEEIKEIVKRYLESVNVGDYITSYKCESDFIRPIYSDDKLLNIDISFKFNEQEQYSKVLKLKFNEVATYAE